MSRYITRAWWMAVGAAIAHYFDPINGRGRRARLRDQLVARWNDLLDLAERRTKYELGRAKGAIIETVHTEDPPRDDRALPRKSMCDCLRDVPLSLPTSARPHDRAAITSSTFVTSDTFCSA